MKLTRRRQAWKRAGAVLLATLLAFGSLPEYDLVVHAQEQAEASPESEETKAEPEETKTESEERQTESEEEQTESEEEQTKSEEEQTKSEEEQTKSEEEQTKSEEEQTESEEEQTESEEEQTKSEEKQTESEENDGINGEAARIITAWEWLDEDEYLDEETGNLALPGASKEHPASFEDVVGFLPTQILATVEDAEDTKAESREESREEPITLGDWSCEDYPEKGAYTGSYTFTATLPEGYALSEEAEALEITVELGGAEMYENTESGDDFTVTGGTKDTDYSYENNVLTIKTDAPITISGETTTDTIVVEKDKDANITLDGVNIDVSSSRDIAAFKIADNSMGNVTITLADGSENTLKSGSNCAGLQKNGGTTTGKLTIQGGTEGTGKLTASSKSWSAGIGGGNNGSGSNIKISGGTVTANGADFGAGIGGGGEGSGSNIEISGGTVTANGGSNGAGIGGGYNGSGSNIKISGGTVTANGGADGAGIGGGAGYPNGGSGSNIEISGGIVTANGGVLAAGIGGGDRGSGSDIIISGGSVKAVAGSRANAIGGGAGEEAVTPTNGNTPVYLLELDSATTSLKIDSKGYPINHGDNKVYAYLTEGVHTIEKDGTSVTNSYAKNPADQLVIIGSNFTVTATSGGSLTYDEDYTYVDGVLTIMSDTPITIRNTDKNNATTDKIVVADTVSANITFAGVNIDVSATDLISTGSAAFKIVDDSTGNVTITLADGSVNTLKGGSWCAGLQKNGGTTTGKLIIQGGTEGTGKLTATGGFEGAGIGGGDRGSGSNITISGGTVTATGGFGGAGIGGGGYNGSGLNITISGGTVTATGDYGAGIGGGNGGSGSNIKISGGTVTATSDYGAGIGGGSDGSGENITITGGTVTATGGRYGAGIGGGENGTGSDIKISGGSVKAVAGADANAIGGGYGKGAVTPINDGTTSVYLLTIANPESKDVLIDGVPYKPVNHKAVDSTDGNLYAYLTGEEHVVQVGEKTIFYTFDSDTFAATLEIKATNGGTLTYGTDYTYAGGVLTIKSDKAVTIANTDPTTATSDRIEVESGVSANITLAGVNIDVSGTDYACAFKIADNSIGDVTITLADSSKNTLKSGYKCAGLQKNGDGEGIGKLTIKGGTNGTGTLTVTGGDCGAGIGGGIGNCGSNIEITGGTVTANGGAANADSGYGGAGIGGGSIYYYYGYRRGNASDITISGGVVTATGSDGGAGIGGGALCSGEKITISGGTVTATGSDGGAGIGGGASGVFEDQEFYGNASDIVITGGSVKAVAGANAYVIGSGEGAVTPTLGDEAKTPVYLLEIANDSGVAITINGESYPTNHNGEKKIYAYLPAKTVADPNVVAVGTETTKYIYDNSKWLIVSTAPVTAPTPNDLVYTGAAQALVTVGTTSYGTMVYSLDENGTYTTAIPTGTDAGTYTVWYKVKDGETYADTLPASVKVTIAKAAPVIINADAVKNQSTVFGTGEFVAPTADVGGTFEYKAGDTTYTGETLKTYLTGINVSDSPVEVGYTFKPTDTTNYKEATGTISFTIEPAPMSDIAPNIAVTPYSGSYDGTGHPVVGTDGITGLAGSDNTICYSTNNKATWSTTVPTITNAGTLDFYVKVTKPNYVDWISEKLTAEVARKPVTVTAENKTKTYGQENPAFTFTVPEGALAGSDTDEALAVELSCEATASSPVTTEGYAITGTSSSANYEVTVIPGTLTITKKSGVTVPAVDRDYRYSSDQEDSIDLKALLPTDCGNIVCGAPQTDGTVAYAVSPSVTDGILSFTVRQGAAGTAGSIRVTAVTGNYEDITITVNLTQSEIVHLRVVRATAITRKYDGTDQVQITDVAIERVESGDDVAVDTKKLTGTIAGKNAGTYDAVTLPALTLVGADAGKYTLVQPEGPVPADVTIEKAEAVITIKSGKERYTKNVDDAPFRLEGITGNSDDAKVQYRVTDSKDEAGKTVADDAVVTVDENGTVTIHGAGTATIVLSLPESTNYHAAQEKTVSIRVTDMPDGLWMEEISDQTYNGKAIKPEVEVYYDRQLLTAGMDYTVSYRNNTNAASADAVNAKGKSIAPTVTVKGKGNFSGTVTKTFTIKPINLDNYKADAQLQEILTIEPVYAKYNGRVIKKAPTVKLNGKTISLSAKQYTCEYNDENPSAEQTAYQDCGTYNITIVGSGKNFVGTTTVTETISEKLITRTKLTARMITQINKSFAYDGTEHSVVKGTDYTITDGATTLVEGRDYTVTYKGNRTNAGTFKVTFTGTGSYSGSVTKSLTIQKASAQALDITLPNSGSVIYTKGGARPQPQVRFNGTLLTEGTDYTVTYRNNTKVASAGDNKAPYLYITGKGNFTGNTKDKPVKFTIVAASLDSQTIVVDNVPYKKKNNNFVPTITITDSTTGKKLAKKTDYLGSFTYEIWDTSANGFVPFKDKKVDASRDNVRMRVKISAAGSYTGQAVAEYEICAKSITSVRVAKIPNQEYTGQAITPKLTITDNGKELTEGTDYTLEYSNNTKKGTASVTIRGKGQYGGSKTVKFKITSRIFKWF